MKSLGQYTLGDQYVSPQNRLSQMLLQQGTENAPSYSWQETMGRLSKSLLGAYMMAKDGKSKDDAYSMLGKQQPDTFTNMPTLDDEQIMNSQGIRDILTAKTDEDFMKNPQIQNAMRGIGGSQDQINQEESFIKNAQDQQIKDKFADAFGNESRGRYVNPEAADREISMGRESIGRANANIDQQSEVFNAAMSRMRGNQPTQDQRGDMVAAELQKQRQASMQPTLDAKMPQRDFMMQNLGGMENNPYAKRLMAQMQMQGMDQDYTAGLANTARSQKLEDIKNAQGFTSSENALNRGATLDAATLKAGEPVNAIKEYLQVKQAGLFKGTFEEYKKSGKSETNVNVGGNAYEKENAGMLVGEHKIARESADNAYRQNMVIAAQRSIPLETGWGAQSKAWGAKFLGALGMANDEALQVANNADQFKSVTMSFLLDKLAAQKGPQTEGDANRALETLASLQNMPDANRFILDLTETLNGHAIEKANFMDSYSMKNGNLIGYRSQWGASDQGKKSIFDSPTMAKWKGRDGTLALKPGQVVDTMPDPSTSKGVTLQGEDGSIFISDGVGWNRQ